MAQVPAPASPDGLRAPGPAAAAALAATAGPSWLEVSAGAVEVDFTGHKVWFDQANRQLLLLRKNVYSSVELRLGARVSAPLSFVRAGKTLDVKFSLCRRFLAIQRSDTAVDVIDLVRATEFKLACRPKRGNLVLRGGVLWLRKDAVKVEVDGEPRTCLCLVTRCGIEVFRMPHSDRGETACKLLGTVKHSVQCFWHLPDHSVLLLATGNGAELRPYQFQGSPMPVKLCKFVVPRAPSHTDIQIVKLYDNIYALYVDLSERRLALIKLGREMTQQVKSLRLFAGGSFGISIVDNLICIHHMDGQFSCVYDIEADTDEPCLAPQAMSYARDTRWSVPRTPRTTESIDSPGTADTIEIECRGRLALRPDQVDGGESDDDGGIFVPTLEEFESADGSYPARLRAALGEVPAGAFLTHIDQISTGGQTFGEVGDMLTACRQRGCTLVFEVDASTGAPVSGDSATDEGHEAAVAGGQASEEHFLSAGRSAHDVVVYAKSWVFLAPNWILDAKKGCIRRIELNLDHVPRYARLLKSISTSSEIVDPSFLLRDARRLYGFLLRRACLAPESSSADFRFGEAARDERAYGKATLLAYLREFLGTCEETVDLVELEMAFKIFNDAYALALRNRSSNPVQNSRPPLSPVLSPTSAVSDGLSSPTMIIASSPSSPRAGPSGAALSVGSGVAASIKSARNLVAHPSFLFNRSGNSSNPPVPPQGVGAPPTSPLSELGSEAGESLPLPLRISVSPPGSVTGGPSPLANLDASVAVPDSASPNSTSSQNLNETELRNSMGSLSQLLEEFRDAGLIALKDIRCNNGQTVVLQIDVFTWVFVPLVPQDCATPSGREQCRRLAMYIAEYLRSLQRSRIPVERYIHELLAWLYVASGKDKELHLLFQYHVLSDSRRLASSLLERSSYYAPFFQVAIDMFFRLGHIDYVVRALLVRGDLLSALEVLKKHPHFLELDHARSGGAGPAPSGAPSLDTVRQDGMSLAPPGTVMITPTEIVRCAAQLVERSSQEVEGSTGSIKARGRTGRQMDQPGKPLSLRSVFTSLYSFFVSVDPWLISPGQDGAGSPLAKQLGGDVFKGLVGSAADPDEVQSVQRALGFAEPLESAA